MKFAVVMIIGGLVMTVDSRGKYMFDNAKHTRSHHDNMAITIVYTPLSLIPLFHTVKLVLQGFLCFFFKRSLCLVAGTAL